MLLESSIAALEEEPKTGDKLIGDKNNPTIQKVEHSITSALSCPLKLQLSRAIEVISLLAIDLGALAAAFTLGYIIRTNLLPVLYSGFPPGAPQNLLTRLWWLPLVIIGYLAYEGLYSKRHSFWRECGYLIKVVTLSYIIAMAVITLAKTGSEVSRTFLVLSWTFTMFLLPAFRYAGKNALAKAGIYKRRVLVLGAGKTGELMAKALNSEPYMGYQIIGFLDDDPRKKQKIFAVNGDKVPVLGGFQDAEHIMSAMDVRNLIVAAPGLPAADLVRLVNRLQKASESVLLVPDLFGIPVMCAEADFFFNERFLTLNLRNNLASRSNIFMKRAFDIVTGTAVLLLLMPVMLLIALAVRLESKGPVIFAHRRVGRNGREFECYKFRTMVANAQEILNKLLEENKDLYSEWARGCKIKDDPRITRVGKFLRKTSLDELPQIFNVFKGEMSLVGPRPIINDEIEKYGEYIDYFYQVRPGITGLWQISGRNQIEYDERVQIDAWYVRNWSLWLDITLLIRTVNAVLTRRGAY
ncbi:undecaprenyl-phosphate galactose phosphotransferase WbaP [Pelotomaculum propionicicum]|uniref:undecaprenyl-phosphate galactose phosphotransferase WbaP n=1 Tax=Pelotomaculum propionicicum TaxID=258475 RepID=UPI003B764809